MFIPTTRLGLLVAAVLTVFTGNASATVFQFNTTGTGVAVTNTFNADQIVLTALGVSTVTVTDGGIIPNGVIDIDPNGLIGGLSTDDTFVETGLVQMVNFRLGGVGILPGVSGLDVNYQLFLVYNDLAIPGLGGPLNGKVAVDSAGNAVVQFLSPTNAKLYLDYGLVAGSPNGVFDIGSSELIASLTLDPTAISNCLVPSLGAAQGTCVIDTVMSTPINTVFTVAGNDTEGAEMRLDFNVDQTRPGPFAAAFPSGELTQVRTIDHDGSARININVVPEPNILALFGLGLLGFWRLTRKK